MALGRGLGELLGEVETAYGKSSGNSNSGVNKIEVSLIKPNPNQPRKIFDEEKLQELSASIKEHGLLQPIVVVEDEDGTYTLIAGERRLRAHKLANIEEIKAIIVDKDEFKLRELALIENIQRDDLNIIELAFCYAQLLNEHNITHEELSKKVFKSRTSITNTLRLLQLSSYVQQFLATDKISAGHAKMMIGLTTEDQKKICDTIIGQKLSVRETEKLIKDLKEKDTPKPKKEKVTNSYNISNLKSFAEFLKNDKIKAKIDKNSIKIEFNSQEDIDKISSYFKIQ
ncbi:MULTISPECIES: ParB/RepB/Spo0J family partition protein [Aliarcobacter]|jgi:ParB family chromosome partitioning protein|uniref:Chromosome partitioning protein ParB n=7 Tax=Arcobacteraceae TaxID=2808963 RepID=A0A1V9VDW1_9BACT|nr:ParB/RepB/Spo0J family partition protein [Aliarcobacter cryaerophilus]NCB10334.1 ParB/RepB/Spo0J family partition protein [Erysipelotrichia bacterium]WNL12050.1 ParB/RepB/Spo0J family partition protein [Arcobacter sp. AZ-2023]WPD05543.1 ParB/RepB/Spo0J family partition protein [Arcobacter sp. DSM 115956]WPD07635.1 ParB/RepB/Spo0J family partition protein [Arcobacter sp. DSM 115955]WPD10664.1 ParB/RepB/Spo0J family partition protein [Arcobacter sp. DSM 115954]WPD12679.1 ParB/RepB/Spo0J fami